MEPEVSRMSWRKSSFSGASDCVAIREFDEEAVAICNSKHPEAGVLVIRRGDLAEWLAQIKSGAYDDLVDAG